MGIVEIYKELQEEQQILLETSRLFSETEMN